MEEYKVCINGGIIPKEPTVKVRGNLARAYFYMSFLYKIQIQNTLEENLRAWHFEDPPDKMEKTRNSLIEQIQGNRNLFIDNPKAVDRVMDF
jgi:deoxyribonuclease-1